MHTIFLLLKNILAGIGLIVLFLSVFFILTKNWWIEDGVCDYCERLKNK